MSKFLPLERWIEGANWRPRLCLAALAVLMAVQISPWLYPAVDGCLYLKTVREFLSTQKLSSFHCYVPPGYLPLIAPAFAFGDRPFLAVSILQWLMAVALIGGLYVWARRQFPATAVLFTSLVMDLNPDVLVGRTIQVDQNIECRMAVPDPQANLRTPRIV